MLTIETTELEISENLKKKVDMICKFACVKTKYKNGNIKSIKILILLMLDHILLRLKIMNI